MDNLPKSCGDCHYEKASDEGDYFYCSYDEKGETIIEDATIRHPDCHLVDDVLDAKRFRVRYRGENLYVIVATMNNIPREVFVKHPIHGKPELHYMMSSWDTCTRLASMALKKYPLRKVVRQLEKSSRTKNDLPGILANLLGQWDGKGYFEQQN